MLGLLDLVALAVISLLPPTILGLWVFGVRTYVGRHGRARITGATWFFSMWADWSTACDIGKETGKASVAAQLFGVAWLAWLLSMAYLLFGGLW